MNKANKIWLNYLIGGVISVLLIWGIYIQVSRQLNSIGPKTLLQTGPHIFLWISFLLMPVNLLLEALKWYLLAGSAQQISYARSVQSVFAGIAFSVITPNRIGEYPARILYLKRKNTLRLISVSILGITAQMLATSVFGFAGLIYYNIHFPGPLAVTALVLCIIMMTVIAILYSYFEKWTPYIERIKRLRKLNIYGQLLKRFSTKEQLVILSISITRYIIYTAQYLILLRWMNVSIPLTEGFLMSSVFFWAIAVVPSIALAELGERGQIGIFLFQNFSNNLLGILTASVGIWLINIAVPALIGSFFMLRMRLFR